MNPTKCHHDRRNQRKLFCRHYDDCLNVAVRAGWANFGCIRCTSNERVDVTPAWVNRDSRKCLDLVVAVFFPHLTFTECRRVRNYLLEVSGA